MATTARHAAEECVLALIRGQEHHVKPAEAYLRIPVIYEERLTASVVKNVQPTLLMIMGDDSYEGFNCVTAAREMGIPSLSMLDGIFEWRNVWENPRYGGGGNDLNKQLILTDKIACPGASSARILEGWGAVGKCELVGVPRFDPLFNTSARRRTETVPKRVLVMTAKKPGFTPEHRTDVFHALRDVRDALAADGRWEIVWRVTGGLDEELGVKTTVVDLTGTDLASVLKQVDAVITTPSTSILEAMALGLPTAVLEYGNRPLYQPAGWVITCQSQIPKALDQMCEPDPRYMLWQEQILKDAIAAPGSGSQRLAELMRALSAIGSQRREGHSVEIPASILQPPRVSACESFILSDLFPNHPVFGRTSTAGILRELQALRQENPALRAKLEATDPMRFLVRCIRKVLGRSHLL
jgi:hypothetical protein